MDHSDTALELLLVNIEKYFGNYEVPMLVGDVFKINNDLFGALDFYKRSLAIKDYTQHMKESM